MHHVVVLALPDVVASDLAAPAQVSGPRTEQGRYALTVCAERPATVPSTTGFAVQASAGLAALQTADTVIVPGFYPLDDPPPTVLRALRRAAGRGARVASVGTGACALAAAGRPAGRARRHPPLAGSRRVRHPVPGRPPPPRRSLRRRGPDPDQRGRRG